MKIDICKKIDVYNALDETKVNSSILGCVEYDIILTAYHNELLSSISRYPINVQRKCVECYEFFEWLSSIDNITTDVVGNINCLLENGMLDWIFRSQLSRVVLSELVTNASYKDRDVLSDKNKLQFIFDNSELFIECGSSVLKYLGKKGCVLGSVGNIIRSGVYDCIDNDVCSIGIQRLLNDDEFYRLVEFLHLECDKYIVGEAILNVNDTKRLLDVLTSIKERLGDRFVHYLLNSKSFTEEMHERFLEGMDVNACIVVMDHLMLLAYTLDKKYVSVVSDSKMYSHVEPLVEYALNSGKYKFLDSVYGNMSVFKNIQKDSMILEEYVYTDLIELDELSMREITMLVNMYGFGNLRLLDHKVTFNTMYRLYGLSRNYILLYNKVLDIELISTLAIHDTLLGKWSEEQIHFLAEWLSKNSIYDFVIEHNLDDRLSYRMIVDVVKCGKENVLYEVRNQNELEFVYKNRESICNDNDIKGMMYRFINDSIEQGMSSLGFDSKYLNENYDSIYDFALCNGFEYVHRLMCNTRISLEQKQKIREVILHELHNDRFFYVDSFEDYEITISSRFLNIMQYLDKPRKRMINVDDGVFAGVFPSLFRDDHRVVTIKKNDRIVANCVLRTFRDYVFVDCVTFTDMNTSVKNYLVNKMVGVVLDAVDGSKVCLDTSYGRYIIDNLRLVQESVFFSMDSDDFGDLFVEMGGRLTVLKSMEIRKDVLVVWRCN